MVTAQDLIRLTYRVEVDWNNRTTTGQTLTDYDTLQTSVHNLRQNPEVLEVRVHTYETRTTLVETEVFGSLVGQ